MDNDHRSSGSCAQMSTGALHMRDTVNRLQLHTSSTVWLQLYYLRYTYM